MFCKTGFYNCFLFFISRKRLHGYSCNRNRFERIGDLPSGIKENYYYSDQITIGVLLNMLSQRTKGAFKLSCTLITPRRQLLKNKIQETKYFHYVCRGKIFVGCRNHQWFRRPTRIRHQNKDLNNWPSEMLLFRGFVISHLYIW